MDTTTTIAAAAIAFALLVAGISLGVVLVRRERTRRLQRQFGPEYDRALQESGDQRAAERELSARLEHVKSLDIRPLSDEEMERFARDWRVTQAKFVEEPLLALQEADREIKEVMAARGYPVQDFEQRAADISVDYPDLASDYRRLKELVARSRADDVSTEELRQAMIHCRALFEKLVGADVRVTETETEAA
jgi:hypothetical protein